MSKVNYTTLEDYMDTLDKEMRDWLLECFSDEYDQEQIEELTHEQLVRSINRYFDGGVRAFIECGLTA